MVAELTKHGRVDAALQCARTLGQLTTIQPRLARNVAGQVQPVYSWDACYAEVGRADPSGAGTAICAIRPGFSVHLSEGRVIRLTANNGSAMTGPGTNTYLVRVTADEWALIDPGSNGDAHIQATLCTLREVGGWLVAIFVTHTHQDHAPAARAIKESTGATCCGRSTDHPDADDSGFVPDVHLKGGERLVLGSECVIRVIHTPGHASNHLCYLLESQRMLFAGDHVMQGSTVIINPPDVDMDAYLASLERLLNDAEREFEVIAPGHGFLMDKPSDVLSALIRHRRRREDKVRPTLADLRRASLDELVARVYDDVDTVRQPAAKRSLVAHLLRLERSGR